MDITVFELHLPKAEFGTPFSGGDRTDGERIDVRPDEPDGSDSGGRSAIAAIAVLIGLAALAWYLRSGSGDGLEADDAMTERPA